jgi:hypothetical protein
VSAKQLDEERFEIIRRFENIITPKPYYERVIYDRKEQVVAMFMLDERKNDTYVEKCIYRAEKLDLVAYDTFLYKNPGLKKMLRFKLHQWGIKTLNKIITDDKIKSKPE